MDDLWLLLAACAPTQWAAPPPEAAPAGLSHPELRTDRAHPPSVAADGVRQAARGREVVLDGAYAALAQRITWLGLKNGDDWRPSPTELLLWSQELGHPALPTLAQTSVVERSELAGIDLDLWQTAPADLVLGVDAVEAGRFGRVVVVGGPLAMDFEAPVDPTVPGTLVGRIRVDAHAARLLVASRDGVQSQPIAVTDGRIEVPLGVGAWVEIVLETDAGEVPAALVGPPGLEPLLPKAPWVLDAVDQARAARGLEPLVRIEGQAPDCAALPPEVDGIRVQRTGRCISLPAAVDDPGATLGRRPLFLVPALDPDTELVHIEVLPNNGGIARAAFLERFEELSVAEARARLARALAAGLPSAKPAPDPTFQAVALQWSVDGAEAGYDKALAAAAKATEDWAVAPVQAQLALTSSDLDELVPKVVTWVDGYRLEHPEVGQPSHVELGIARCARGDGADLWCAIVALGLPRE